jgi:ligand-binding sensor domain-containing protein
MTKQFKMAIKTIFLFSILTTFVYCKGQQPFETKKAQLFTSTVGETVSKLGKNIDCIFEDKYGNYWFASNGEGAYRYDGKTITHFTTKDGLCSDFVFSITEDIHGKLWFSTRDGTCFYNGFSIINYTDKIVNAPKGKFNYKKSGLFFNHSNGVCFYDGTSFTNFVIHPADYSPPTNTMYRPYGVYSTLVANSGKVYFGTQEKGVSVYDGKSFLYINGKDLDGPAVRCIFQDKRGNVWFGNNGGGLFQYDGKALRNITEEKKLTNYEFLKGKKPVNKLGSLARVFAINEDQAGNLWIGTVDAGIWKYDGSNLTNYTTKDGLSSNTVYGIYKTLLQRG